MRTRPSSRPDILLRVTSVDSGGNESAFSTEASATVPHLSSWLAWGFLLYYFGDSGRKELRKGYSRNTNHIPQFLPQCQHHTKNVSVPKFFAGFLGCLGRRRIGANDEKNSVAQPSNTLASATGSAGGESIIIQSNAGLARSGTVSSVAGNHLRRVRHVVSAGTKQRPSSCPR